MMRILGTAPEDRSARKKTKWFHEFAQHEDAFDLGDMKDLPPGASLPDVYQHYMHHAENVHRFVRAPFLHSFVFMWLMSKYKEFSIFDEFSDTALVAFERGVQGAADRNSGSRTAIGRAARARRRRLARKKLRNFSRGRRKTGRPFRRRISNSRSAWPAA